MTSTINYILGSDSLTVFVRGKSYTVNKQAKTFDLVLSGVKENNEQKVYDAVNIKESITSALNASSGVVRIEDSKIFYADREVTGVIASRIFEVIKLGLDVQPMVKFLENLMKNPSKRAVDEAFGFIEACSLPITPDGCFLAYKRVRADYRDVHSGTVLNKPYNLFTVEDSVAINASQGKLGEVEVEVINGVTTVSMPRNLVNEDKDKTCSEGLHFCSYNYLQHFGGARIVVLKINPADIVSIPADYNNSKGRCSKYQVVDELEVENNLPKQAIPDGFVADYTGTVPSLPKTKIQGILDKRGCSAIRGELALGTSIRELARRFNVSRRTIARVRDRESPYNN